MGGNELIEEKKFNSIKRDYTKIAQKWQYEKKIEKLQERIQNKTRKNEIYIY